MNGHSLLYLIITQAWQVTFLACLVLLLTKLFAKDRPHLAHSLWALVLLKCVLPPIILSPTSIYGWASHGYTVAVENMAWSTTGNSPNAAVDVVEGIAPLVVRVSPGGIAAMHIDTTSEPLAPTSHAEFGRSNLVAFAICTWIVISMSVFALNALRLGVFLRRVKRASLPSSPSLNQLVESLSKRIGLRRKVRICTVDAAIGPAVVGFIRPTILIPRVMVEGRSNSQLEPILAHELIHVRRGDLAWAMLQATAVALWWFHPLVWLAERLLTREAERSCDEETIAGLGCSPAVYARSLLDVMERKQQLRAAPSLPGVRPVDITAKRLERIMRLGHGCHRQRPWWVVAVWLIGCAMFLPGGAWLTAQENLKQDSGVFKEASFGAEKRIQSAEQGSVPVDAPAVEKEPIDELAFEFEYVLELADLLERLCKERALDKADAEKELIRMLQPLAAPTLEAAADDSTERSEASRERSVDLSPENARMLTRGTSLRVAGNELHVRATKEKRKQIAQRLAHFRQFGFGSIVTELEFYEVPRRLSEKDLAAISAKVTSQERAATTERIEIKEQGDVTSDLGLTGTLTIAPQLGPMVLNDAEIAKLEEWLAEDDNRDVSHVSAPRVTGLSGQSTTIEIGDARDFTLSHRLVKSKDREPTAVPVTQRVTAGARYEIRATLAEGQKHDKQNIKLNAKFQKTTIERIEKSKQRLDGIEAELDVERPIVRGQSLETSVELGVDQALVVMQTSENKTSITIIRCTPLLAELAYVPRANLGEQVRIAHVTVSDELRSDLEVALLKQKLEQLGIEDFRIAEGRIQVNFAEDWKAATKAFQELRSNRNSTTGSTNDSPQKGSANTPFTDGETAYQPISVCGPLVGHQEISMPGQVPSINRQDNAAVKLSVPSDDEVFRVLESYQSQRGRPLRSVELGKTKLTVTKIKQFSDPGRFVPLIGDAILHHSHYKCELHDAATQELMEVVYLDYCQFQVDGK